MNENDFDFENDFMTDYEAEEAFDDIILAFDGQGDQDMTAVSIVNPERLKCIALAYKIIKYLIKGKNVKFAYDIHEPYTSMGSISVVGRELKVENPTLFVKVVKLASNFEVYPRTDGTVQMDFTFHKLTIKEGE